MGLLLTRLVVLLGAKTQRFRAPRTRVVVPSLVLSHVCTFLFEHESTSISRRIPRKYARFALVCSEWYQCILDALCCQKLRHAVVFHNFPRHFWNSFVLRREWLRDLRVFDTMEIPIGIWRLTASHCPHLRVLDLVFMDTPDVPNSILPQVRQLCPRLEVLRVGMNSSLETQESSEMIFQTLVSDTSPLPRLCELEVHIPFARFRQPQVMAT